MNASVHDGRHLSVLALALLFALTFWVSPAITLASEDATDGASQDTSTTQQESYELQQQSTPVTDAVPSEIQQRVEQTASAYNDAVSTREGLEAQIADNQSRIAELQAQLPQLQDQASDAIVASYKSSQGVGTLLALILSSQDFESLISSIEYCNDMQRYNTDQINELVAAEQELTALESDLEEQLTQAQQAEQDASDALAQAQQARADAIAAAQAAAAQAAAEQAAAQQAAEAAAAAQATNAGSGEASATSQATSGQAVETTSAAQATDSSTAQPAEATAETSAETSTASGASDATDLTSDRDTFIAQWASRIDAYLAGSPLSGMGSTFAAAAWDYGIDPRISPAIAYVESSLGAYCFRPYNAWGWGSSSWGSWSEAIYAHVAGMSRAYGSTLDYDDALSYCPSDASGWYSSVTAQMSSI
ncbi:MAG: hypothetical protein SOI26_07050 [Coriobacteriales bacterium]|jgi:peptidoglycan hydrolase CwlO-like protein